MDPGDKIGPFEVEKELGSGAMGTVYRGFQNRDKEGKPSRPVAIKVISFGLVGNDAAMRRFARESEILKQLRHPHIVRLHATGTHKKTPFIVMEFVDGEALDRTLGRRGKLGWEEVVGYAKQLCDALQHAHEKGIIHRDLKPSNLMVTTDGTLKLTDFGIAKDTDVTALTGMNSTIGTAAYMSPEQCKGERNLTNKSDLYSLGVVLYELLTGKKPFVADTTLDMFHKHVYEPAVRSSKLEPNIPIWLDSLIDQLMEKDKDKRPLDAARVGTLLAEIEQKVADQQSAGAELANARRGDRAGGLDADDRAAAKSLRAGKKKRKKKAEAAGLPVWAKAVPLVLALGAAVGGGVWLFTRDGGSPEPVASGPGPGPGDEPVKPKPKPKADPREPKGKMIETVIEKWVRRNKAGTPERADEERREVAYRAVQAEQAGDLPKARDQWKKVVGLGPAPDEYYDGWIWLAEQRLAAIEGADRLLQETRKRVLDGQLSEVPWKLDSDDPASVAALAVRYGGGGGVLPPPTPGDRVPLKYLPPDPVYLKKAWADLYTLTEPKPELRAWFLLAAREKGRVGDPKPDEAIASRKKAVAELLQLVASEWEQVKGDTADLYAAQRRDIRNRLRDVIELYKDEPDDDVRKAVEQAGKMLTEASKKPAG